MNMMDTIKGSMMENFFPKGWDLQKIEDCCATAPERALDRMPHWHKDFVTEECVDVASFNMQMGYEIAKQIKRTRDESKKLALILSVGPMGMYKWAVYFLKDWNCSCDHVSGFNMDEWSDAQGNTLPSDDPGAFQNAMQEVFYGPLGDLTVPKNQRNFATKDNLPQYADKIQKIKDSGGELITIYGIGRCFHIAFWEPHFAEDYENVEEWKKATHRRAAKLHPMTIEQNSLISFKSRVTLIPALANTVGPGLFLNSDYCIGGVDGVVGRGMNWQGMTFFVTLKYGPDMWVPSSWMPTMPGKFFVVKELKGPLIPECN
ncbi:MAG: glucosamine-6-phosphate isomerase [Clostridia bacterium]|jgi:glucosamine-6-phosphate deaminase|nr:glucosamine-6-phosphate isomerase [Clostridia bacterium]